MKYSDIIQILKNVVKMSNDPMFLVNKPVKSNISNASNKVNLKNNINSNIYIEPEDDNIEYNKGVPVKDSKSSEEGNSYDGSQSNNNIGCCNRQQDISSGSQGIIDSIAKELTSVRLQQAIILSEIVGKPRSKTRKRRRF